MILVIILPVLFVAGILIPVIGLIRNQKVAKMRGMLIDRIFRDNNYKHRLKIYHSVTYEKMALDIFRPLKLETYWTKEQIDEMLND